MEELCVYCYFFWVFVCYLFYFLYYDVRFHLGTQKYIIFSYLLCVFVALLCGFISTKGLLRSCEGRRSRSDGEGLEENRVGGQRDVQGKW